MNKFLLLRHVARSFYLSIRLLPTVLQEPIALAYLLARASDTIVDKEEARRTAPEKELIRLLPTLVEELNMPQQDPFDADAIKVVWQKILEGQAWDTERHRSECSNAALSLEELDRYLYLVAGSVGEFWTMLAAHHLPSFSQEPLEKMMRWAINYGKGLQLTNILRDYNEDALSGRCYSTKKQLPQLQTKALAYLEEGWHYVRALRPGRFKMASALPLLLAEKTLRLVVNNPEAIKVKVSRSEVYMTLCRASVMLFF